jgi:hypothetical protein
MWLKQAYQTIRRVLGKVKSGVETGARIFNKGKAIYGGVKNFASNLPIIGTAAGNAIARGEAQANDYAKKNLGVNFGDVDRVVSTAERVAKYLPSN